ncbi:MAG TPA: TatD family hydrolase [Candidatus Binataceae bacterium]|nr:TatD family hydrolase [Candidatus Binataceae bacterium]
MPERSAGRRIVARGGAPRYRLMIDTHIHLDADQYADPSSTIKRAREAGVRAVVVPGVSPASNRAVLELARRFPGFVHAALGFHPERYELTDREFEATVAMIRAERSSICAIGEVGLPWYGDSAHDQSVRARMRERLDTMGRLAVELDLPLILHAPHNSAAEALRVIASAGAPRAVFHWHKSDEATTRAIIDAGHFISITPEVVYRERDRDLARIVPLQHLLVETDGPWQYGDRFSGRITEPAMVADAIAAIAAIKAETFATVREIATENAARLFRLKFP